MGMFMLYTLVMIGGRGREYKDAAERTRAIFPGWSRDDSPLDNESKFLLYSDRENSRHWLEKV